VGDRQRRGVRADEDVHPVVVAEDAPDLQAVRAGRPPQRPKDVVADDRLQQPVLVPPGFLLAPVGLLPQLRPGHSLSDVGAVGTCILRGQHAGGTPGGPLSGRSAASSAQIALRPRHGGGGQEVLRG